jgi:rhodanese-related sulfurtransferase
MESDPVTLMQQIAAGTAPLIIDVRSKREFDQGHVPGATHIPFWKIAAQSAGLSAFRNQPVVLYCGHGPRAYMAGAALKRRGFTAVAYLTGHMKQWKELNLPMEVA